jgi:hypothetical protein
MADDFAHIKAGAFNQYARYIIDKAIFFLNIVEHPHNDGIVVDSPFVKIPLKIY